MKQIRLTRKLLMGTAVACALSVSLASCSDDDEGSTTTPTTPPSTGAPEKIIGLDITSNTTWTKDTVYILASRIKVRPGATLTINAGTIIKGSPGQESNAKVLMVMRGAKIMANGTATEPIIFTSTGDNIQPGEIASPNLPNDFTGQWGGLAILGNARISSGTPDATDPTFDVDQIEGVPSSDPDGLYGGKDDADNSGILRYVSVRHGGTQIGGGDELNGISFGGVGSGTVVENIEIVANADDGLEFYGGTVSATNVVIWNNGDDALDTDQAWNGTVDNFVLLGPAGSALELDGPEGTYVNGRHTLKNGTVVATRGDGTASGSLIDWDGGGSKSTNVNIQDVHFQGLQAGQKVNKTDDPDTDVGLTNITLDVPAGATLANYLGTNISAANSAQITTGTTGKANVSVFANWSWAHVNGEMSGL